MLINCIEIRFTYCGLKIFSLILRLDTLLESGYMDLKTLEFVTYCISKLAQVLNISQREVYRRLKQSGILYDYIVPSYDVLHTFSSRYLVEDLTDYMREKGVLPQ